MLRKRCSNLLHGFMRKTGEWSAGRPFLTISLSLLLTGVVSLGLLRLNQERNPLKLWVPPDSSFSRDTNWLLNRTSKAYRMQQIIIQRDEGVLKPDAISFLVRLMKNVSRVTGTVGDETIAWSDICFKIPSVAGIPGAVGKSKKRSIRDEDRSRFDDTFFGENHSPTANSTDYDPSIELDIGFYCSLFDSLPLECMTSGIGELWKEEELDDLDENDILDRISKTHSSPITGHPVDYETTLSGIAYDDEGKIVNAGALSFTWFVTVDLDRVDPLQTGNRVGTEDWATPESLAWEKMFLETAENASSQATTLGLKFVYSAGRSFGDISSSGMLKDTKKILGGAALMFTYILVILSKWDPVEIRIALAFSALFCVALSLICSIGFCSLIGIPLGPVHDSLPFLLMGLGIDDMFVIKACWDSLSKEERSLSSVKKIGLTMSHAGVSILVTSFTDVIAFLVGSITVLPSLQSFCLYAAVAVLFLFIFSITLYVAAFSLDLRRVEAGRNGFLPCIKHALPRPSSDGEPISRRILRKLYSGFIFKGPVKIIIIVATIIMTGFSLEALLRIDQRFDPNWFIPKTSYYGKFLQSSLDNFPKSGYEALYLVGAVDYGEDLKRIVLTVEKIRNESELIRTVESWTDPFANFVATHFNKNIHMDTLTEREWDVSLGKFLISPKGAKYRKNFQFYGKFACGEPAPRVKFSSVEFSFRKFNGPAEHLPAMRRIREIANEANISTGENFSTVWSKTFANWVTDEVIETEVERNLELALLCVMACTFILIMNVPICLWIFICVMLTLINVIGWMQRWGMSIDVVSCVGLELAIGLCVDYAAHVGHTFLLMRGTKEERALNTVVSIGAAVMYGGGSTLLSLSVLVFSETYIFQTFFKIFLLVVAFGLFNGIVFLPVVLSRFGPGPPEIARKADSAIEDMDMEQLSHLDPAK